MAKLSLYLKGNLATLTFTRSEAASIHRLKSLVALNYEDEYGMYPLRQEGDEGGESSGKRGKVFRLSEQSRRRFMRETAQLDYSALAKTSAFLTYTYPDEYPNDPKIWHRHLEALNGRLTRNFSKKLGRHKYRSEFGAIWRVEFELQKQGVSAGLLDPHLHMILHLHDKNQHGPTKWLSEQKEWLSEAWREIIDPEGAYEYIKDVDVVVLRTEEEVAKMLMYIAKRDPVNVAEHYPEGTGRVWGRFSRHHLPLSPVLEIDLTPTQLNALHREFERRVKRLTKTFSCLFDKTFWPFLKSIGIPIDEIIAAQSASVSST